MGGNSYIDPNGRYQRYTETNKPLYYCDVAHIIRMISRIDEIAQGNNSDAITKIKICIIDAYIHKMSLVVDKGISFLVDKRISFLVGKWAKTVKKEDGELLFFAEECNFFGQSFPDPKFFCIALDAALNTSVRNMSSTIVSLAQKKPALFQKSEIQLILTGSARKSSINEKGEFFDVNIRVRTKLFILANTQADICFRLVELSNYITETDQANKIAIFLNYHAIKSFENFENALTRVEQALNNKNLDDILLEVKNIASDTSTGRIIKTIRNDELCFWSDVEKSIADPAGHRPELRAGERGAFTNRLNGDKYEVVSTDKSQRPSLHGDEKLKYTRPQSTSYVNYEVGYDAPCFGYNLERQDLLVGISFAIKDCIPQRIMTYDNGTIARPYDAKTKEEAQKYLAAQLENGKYHTAYVSLQEKGLSDNANKITEVMAGYCWNRDGSSHITVFSDNVESRLLAQARAKSLELRLRKQFSDETITVPISIYPDFSIYTKEEQNEDRIQAKAKSQLTHYLKIINLFDSLQEKKSEEEIKATMVSPNEFRFESFLETYILLCKTSPVDAAIYFENEISKTIMRKSDEKNITPILLEAIKVSIKNNQPADLIKQIITQIFSYYRFLIDTGSGRGFMFEVIKFTASVADLTTLKNVYGTCNENLNTYGLPGFFYSDLSNISKNLIWNPVCCNIDNIKYFIDIIPHSRKTLFWRIDYLTIPCVIALILGKTDIYNYVFAKVSAADVLKELAKSDANLSHTKSFFEANSDKLTQKAVTDALQNARDAAPETVKFFCNLTAENTPSLSKIDLIDAVQIQRNFMVGMNRSHLTKLKQFIAQEILNYINSLGEIVIDTSQFKVGFFSKKIRNAKLCEEKVAHARALIKNISASENPGEIKYLLARAELHNTIEFEPLRTSGKSRYATCLAKMIQRVSQELISIQTAVITL
ncbi:MAG: hypothetical protein A3E82_07945 [Gammaproteobacteria bacterium RIFCSPHIGHO2_12_FULL_38_11]|nr:MAG: hypothetical protein A3E82_07945 [Gammaproteobacteria bacterium RIFCSPHIGHO2_12_FULL_38_11]